MAKDIKKFCHPDYAKYMQDYEKIRDCYEGERAIKDKGVKYLKRLKAQSQEDYDNYLFRALFFPITGKTVTSMVGMATTKPPEVKYPADMEKYFVDTEPGYQFTETYVSTFSEVTLMGRYGILIDAPMLGDPYPTAYLAENIVNWRLDSSTKLPVMLLLRECRVVPGEDQFEMVEVVQYRHCFMNGGIYYQEVLDDDLKVVIPAFAPTFSGVTIDFIPFTVIGATGIHMEADKPPMLDISTINISHYLTSADLEWGRHIVGLPTPVVSGVDSSTKLSIGGTSAWILPVVEAKAFYLEFQGQGLKSLEYAMTEKVGLMATMSARLVDSSTRGSEAAETVKLRYMSESASLIHIISSVETGMRLVYTMLAKLKKASGPVTMTFSREILGINITFKDLEILFEAYLNGEISRESLLYNMRRLDAVDPSRTDQEELDAIKDPPPKPSPTPAAPQPTR